MEHAPGPRASPQLPHGLGFGESERLAEVDFEDIAKTES
jgi:hypothetical protein